MDATSAYGVVDNVDVGITELLRPAGVGGIGGVIKVRPEDFCVNEIRLSDGTVVEMPPDVDFTDAGSTCASTPSPDESSAGDGLSSEDSRWGSKFILAKTRTDTLEAVHLLSNAVTSYIGVAAGRGAVRDFGFAGIKDSWAVTVQEVTVKGVATEELEGAVARFLPSSVQIRDCRPCDREDKLRPGMLGGNRFRIRIREVHPTVSQQQLDDTLGHVRDHGFINYVGMQRFGKGGVASPDVGLAYIKRDYSGAIDRLMSDPAADKPVSVKGGHTTKHNSSSWQSVWRKTYCASAVLAAMDRQLGKSSGAAYAQRRVMEHMTVAQSQLNMDWKASCRYAFLSIPKYLRMLYAHAYFDRVWNLGASAWVNESQCRDSGREKPLPGDLIRIGSKMDGYVKYYDEEEDTDATVYDVVLPRPGRDALFPDNFVGTVMRQYYAFDGVDVEDVTVEQNQAGEVWDILGDYRNVLSRAAGLKWQLVEEADVTGTIQRHCNTEFSLAPGQYATMFLREVMELKEGGRGCKKRRIIFDDSDDD
ncbi:tRNA pseudouridine synthase D, putative [Perkinsus marinus ATCC 50983]|uniref:tRNA pseudouridine synthase D, putative n=1 Tax=Perkinsus marinus (strain ATCC 50983 / TXsc) TaxID=423536 RepID=C5LMN9_PERM5|nr:tRNA pseudouridine synthase D, putative [Perkinsus marinus ATCC 50983]EER01930.1 tRNA pseudouridine synthase D, putative [Perkinsus marinus ATCC 50983]|eukprot:XP_002769212.1 tRNA pseudouridine synthase D, putative [Perkinsus marinus ATCC 50983]